MANKSIIELIVNGIDNFSKEISDGVDKTNKKLKSVGESMTKTGAVMTGALTVPIVAGFGASVMAASDLGESVSAVQTVFGDASDTIYEFGQTSATAVGLSEQQFNALSLVTGSFLQNLGYDAAEAAQETVKLTERASDMAAVFNTDVDQALMAIQSGLKGEFNPLEQFGVKMNAASIEAKALEMGLADTKAELDDNAKAQAALAIVMDQTNRIQGTFTEEAESLGGSMRVMKAQLRDAAAALGEQLLPYVTKAANYLRELIERFNNLSPAIQRTIVIVGVIVAAIGPLLMIVGSLITTFTTIMPVIAAVAGAISGLAAPILAIVAVVALLVTAWKTNFMGIQDYTKQAWNRLMVIFNAIKEWLSVFIPAAIQVVTNYWNNILLPAFQMVWGFIQNNLLPIFRAIADFLGATFSLVTTIIAGIWQNVLMPAFQAVGNYIGGKLQPIFKVLTDFWNSTLLPLIQRVADWIAQKLSPAFEGLKSILGGVADFFKNLADMMKNLKDKLPDWMTPGSPTPLEMGLWGINDALKEVTRRTLPNFQSELNIGANVNPSSGMMGNGHIDNRKYILNMPTSNNPEDVGLAFDLMQAYGGV